MSSSKSSPKSIKFDNIKSKDLEYTKLKNNLIQNKINYETANKNIILDSKLNNFSPIKSKCNKQDLITKPMIYFPTTITSKEGTKDKFSIHSITSPDNIFFGESKPSLTSLESKNEMVIFNKVQLKKNNTLSQEKQLLIPIDKKNDEKYKLLTIQKIKNKFPPFKSAKRFEEEEKKVFRNSLDEAEKYAILKKKKIIYSNKKDIFVFVSLFNNKEKEFKFPLFRDNDIGIYKYWQAKIVDSQVDEDDDTDDEQEKVAKYYCIKELKEAFEVLQDKGNKIVQNTKFLD